MVPIVTAGLPALTASLSLELAPVRVSLIAAGFVDTPLSASLLGERTRQPAQSASRHATFGFAVNGDVRVDMKRVKARKDEISGRSNRGVEQWLRGLENCKVIQGHARFESSNSVAVNDEVLEADKIFINVGGRATIPEFPRIDDVPFFTNSSMVDVDFSPEHLVIVGGSYIVLEFGQMYCRFGSEVTIVEMGPRLIGREDEDVSEAVRKILSLRGFKFG